MTTRLASFGASTASALLLAGAALAAGPSAHTVTIEATAFAPASLEVRRGERVVFRNRDPFPHTATARNGTFDSGSIAAGASWTYVAAKAGTFDYVCTLHPGMTGRLVVR